MLTREKRKKQQEKEKAALEEFRRERPQTKAWDCVGCGQQYETQPFRCSKCGSFSFERVNKEYQ